MQLLYIAAAAAAAAAARLTTAVQLPQVLVTNNSTADDVM